MAAQNLTRNNEENEFEERVVHINRCAKVVKGGRRFSFAAIVVVGDKKGRVGMGLGKAGEVPEAIKKATKTAKKNLISVTLLGSSIPFEVIGKFAASRVLMKPAPEGSGVIASSSVRAVLECVGVQNILTKSIRRDNPHNVVRATMEGLSQLRSFEEIAKSRGKNVSDLSHN